MPSSDFLNASFRIVQIDLHHWSPIYWHGLLVTFLGFAPTESAGSPVVLNLVTILAKAYTSLTTVPHLQKKAWICWVNCRAKDRIVPEKKLDRATSVSASLMMAWGVNELGSSTRGQRVIDQSYLSEV